jgi:hypothetical protein
MNPTACSDDTAESLNLTHMKRMSPEDPPAINNSCSVSCNAFDQCHSMSVLISFNFVQFRSFASSNVTQFRSFASSNLAQFRSFASTNFVQSRSIPFFRVDQSRSISFFRVVQFRSISLFRVDQFHSIFSKSIRAFLRALDQADSLKGERMK